MSDESRSLREISAASGMAAVVAAITQFAARSAADPPCDEHATVFLATGAVMTNLGEGSITFEVTGFEGAQAFTFASGSTAGYIAATIDLFTKQTGVSAWCDCDAPQQTGVVLESNVASSSAFVSVQQQNGVAPIVYPASGAGSPSYRLTTFGTSGLPGDANCDGSVGLVDLQHVLQSWGECGNARPCSGDLTGDGIVDVDDLLRVINNWGQNGSPNT